MKTIDWSKRDLFNAIGRPELRPKWIKDLDAEKNLFDEVQTNINKAFGFNYKPIKV